MTAQARQSLRFDKKHQLSQRKSSGGILNNKQRAHHSNSQNLSQNQLIQPFALQKPAKQGQTNRGDKDQKTQQIDSKSG